VPAENSRDDTRPGRFCLAGSERLPLQLHGGKLRILLVIACVFFAAGHSRAQLASTSWPMYQHDIGRTGQASATGPSTTPGALWSTQLAGGIRNQSAIAADNTVYVGAQGGLLYAVNPDGSVKWNFATGVTFQSNVNAPAINADGTIYYGTLNGTPSSNTKGFLFFTDHRNRPSSDQRNGATC